MSTPTPPPGDDPTQRIPTTPPTGQPVAPAAGPGAPVPGPTGQPEAPRPAPHQAPKDTSMPWKVATGVLALTTIGFAIWGFNTNSKLNNLQASTDQQIQSLQAQLNSEESAAGKKEAEQAKEIEALRNNVSEYKGNLKVDTKKIKQESAQIAQLNQRYQNAQRVAAQKEGNLQAQLNAANAQAALAKKCASVMASGLLTIYQDVPTVVTYKEVDAVLKQASNTCGDVINVQVP